MNEYVREAARRNGIISRSEENKPGKKKSQSISTRLKKAKTYERQQDIMQEWAEGWQQDMENTLLRLRRAAMRDDHGEIMHMIDQIKGMSDKRFTGLENAIRIVSDPDRDLTVGTDKDIE